MKQIELRPAGHSSNTLFSRSQFKPILFSTPMVQAILAGRKTQTRRIIKEANGWDINWKVMPIKEEHLDGVQRYEIRCGTQYHLPWFKAKCEVGNIFWVRETFTIIDWWEDSKAVQIMYEDAKTALKTLTDIEWKKFENWDNKSERKPSLFLFKSLSRIFLEVTDIRAERLHDITGDDALSEGAKILEGTILWYNYVQDRFTCGSSIESYKSLWQKINGVESWEENPIVWVVTFATAECTQGFC